MRVRSTSPPSTEFTLSFKTPPSLEKVGASSLAFLSASHCFHAYVWVCTSTCTRSSLLDPVTVTSPWGLLITSVVAFGMDEVIELSASWRSPKR